MSLPAVTGRVMNWARRACSIHFDSVRSWLQPYSNLGSDHPTMESLLAHLVYIANLNAGWLLLGRGDVEKQRKYLLL